MPNYANETILKIQNQVGTDKVILALSGGVDSSVAGLLIDKAIHTNLICIFVDNGLLRYNEAKQVMTTYQQNMGLNIIKIDAKQEFYQELAGITDPEQKRKIIGRLFIEIFQREAKKIPDAKWLAQGTIYPDVIESAGTKTGIAHNIKSHHNVGGLPESLHLKLLEPLRELFKDEVRTLGTVLGLPKEMVYRHPFPGPGLAVRILGDIRPEFVSLLQHADHIFIEELIKHNWYAKVSQAFAVFLPIKSVGVMGDGRTYDYVISLRAVETTDFMTATVANLPFEFITMVANRIINEVRGINRVVYDISGKPPATIEWE
jgi:GMP synthase (glutamine-hydrolysing)